MEGERYVLENNITVIIPTYQEEKRITACLKSVLPIASRVILMDNMSTDATCEIAVSLGAEVIRSEKTYKERVQEAIDRPDIDTDWIMYVDADEVITEQAAAEIRELCDKHKNSQVSGIVCKYRKVFMGKELVHSGSDEWKVRLFKKGAAELEQHIELHEHILLKYGKTSSMKKSHILHYSYRDVNQLTMKQNEFARRGAAELLRLSNGKESIEYKGLAPVSKIRRIIKFKLYRHLPIGLRSWLSYAYQYYGHLGFLDGIEGKMYVYFRYYWYNMLTDAYYLEMKKQKEQAK